MGLDRGGLEACWSVSRGQRCVRDGGTSCANVWCFLAIDEGVTHYRQPTHQASQSTLSSLTPSQATISHTLSPTALSFMQMTQRNGSNISLDGVVHTNLDKALEERLWDVIQEQNDRISSLEKEYRRLATAIAGTGKVSLTVVAMSMQVVN